MPSTSASDKPLTAPQLRVLRNLMAGRDASHGLRGRSQFGGLNGTLFSLHQRKLIDRENQVTQAGYKAVALQGIKKRPLEMMELVSDAIVALQKARSLANDWMPDTADKSERAVHQLQLGAIDTAINDIVRRLNDLALPKSG